MIYVGSASGPQFDQELEDVVVGPVPVGLSKFVLSTPPPDPKLIPEDDLLGATVVLICCSYKGAEFIRVGYWINNTYGEALQEGACRSARLLPWRCSRPSVAFCSFPYRASSFLGVVIVVVVFAAGEEAPKPIPPEKIIRSILADKPRVTRFNIEDWS